MTWWASEIAKTAQVADIGQKLRDKSYNKEDVYRTGGGSYDFLLKNPQYRFRERLSSAYITPDGEVHILQPHKHDETARNILAPVVEGTGKVLSKAERMELDSRAMPLYTGAVRAQFYPDGVGVTINMEVPPTRQQIQALKEHYDRTTKGVFVAEIIHGKDLLAHITDYDSLVTYLQNYKKPGSGVDEQEDIKRQLRLQQSDEERINREINHSLLTKDPSELWMGNQKVAKKKTIIIM